MRSGESDGSRRYGHGAGWMPAIQVAVLMAATSGMLAWWGWWNRAAVDAAPQPAKLYERLANGQTATVAASVTWTTAEGEGGPGVVAHVTVPERGLAISVSFRKNLDAGIPASHVVEIASEATAAFAGGRIESIPALMVPTLKAPKALTGVSAKIGDGAFLIGLSPVPRDVAANLRLLRYSPLIDLPLVYASGQRAALEFPKGAVSEPFFRAAMVESARAGGAAVR